MTTLGILMDPIGAINIKKDSSFAMLLAAQARGWQLRYMEMGDLSLRDGAAYGRMPAGDHCRSATIPATGFSWARPRTAGSATWMWC